MRDLDCFDALADLDRPEDEIVGWLEQLAELPLSDRWPWFARVLPWVSRSPRLRVAALTALDGAVGLEARRAVVAALDDDDDAVRARAVRNMTAIGRADGHAWAHALYHARGDVRRAALSGLGEVDLPQWAMLPLLADEAAAPEMERRLLEGGLGPGSVQYLLRLIASDEIGRTIGLRCLASLNWRHQLEAVLKATPGVRRVDEPAERPWGERVEAWRAEPDDLDRLVGLVVAGARDGDAHAAEVLDRWRHQAAAGGSVTGDERRLAVSLLVQPPPLPPKALAMVLLAFPEAIDAVDLAVLWPALGSYAEVADGPLPSVKRAGFVERHELPGSIWGRSPGSCGSSAPARCTRCCATPTCPATPSSTRWSRSPRRRPGSSGCRSSLAATARRGGSSSWTSSPAGVPRPRRCSPTPRSACPTPSSR